MSKTIERLILSGLVALALAVPTYATAGDTLQRVIDFKVLRVGMSGNQPPMTMISRDGGMMGFDVDLAAGASDGDESKAGNRSNAFWRADGGIGKRRN